MIRAKLLAGRELLALAFSIGQRLTLPEAAKALRSMINHHFSSVSPSDYLGLEIKIEELSNRCGNLIHRDCKIMDTLRITEICQPQFQAFFSFLVSRLHTKLKLL